MSVREKIAKALPWVTGAWVLFELVSLRLGTLNCFFWDAQHADVQGIDYYSLPKAWLNLVAGKSPYDSFGVPTFGPHFTWYLAHPALAVVLGSWLSAFDPTTSYGVYTILSLAMMAGCAWVLARESDDALVHAVIWLLVLGAFPTYWMLFVGNVQAVLVLALGMLLAGLMRMAKGERGEGLVLAGLLVSLLTKPVVLLTLPLLLMVKETRRAAIRALAVYVAVSLVFEVVPVLNPEAIGLRQVGWLAVHPAFVRETMNIYANGLRVTPQMKDNSVHWFNLVAQADVRMVHVDVFSLPVFLDTVLGVRVFGWVYALPSLIGLGLSVFVARMKVRRMDAVILLVMGISLVFFLGYPTVWEYQYTSVLPVAAVLLMMRRWGMFAVAACAWLPSFYFLGGELTRVGMTLIRVDRVVPVTVLCFWLMWESFRLVRADGARG